jgi:hypothetical protein
MTEPIQLYMDYTHVPVDPCDDSMIPFTHSPLHSTYYEISVLTSRDENAKRTQNENRSKRDKRNVNRDKKHKDEGKVKDKDKDKEKKKCAIHRCK